MKASIKQISSEIRAAIRKTLPETTVNSLARQTGAVKRQGKVQIYDLVCTLVLGFGSGDKRTLAALRRSYELTAGHTIEESAFYKRFTPELVALMKGLLVHAFAQLQGVGRLLQGPLAQFRDILLTDSTVVRLHHLLSKVYPACRTNHTKAAMKAHVVMSVRGAGRSSIKVTSERRHDGPVFTIGPWIKGHLLLYDLGTFATSSSTPSAETGATSSRMKKTNPIVM